MKRPEETINIKDRLQKEVEMKAAFWEKTDDILTNEGRYVKRPGGIKVGLEIEAAVLTKNFDQASEQTRNAIIADNPDFTDVELGAAQLEWRTDPINLCERGVEGLVQDYVTKEGKIKASVSQHNAYLLTCGSNPFVAIDGIVRTSKSKYQLVPNFHNQNQKPGLETTIGLRKKVDVRDAAVVSLSNSIQCNLEATGFRDAVDLLNRSIAIGPMAVSLSGNSRFLEGEDTGLADTRMIAWEISHDTRTTEERLEGVVTRIGLPKAYYVDLKDYFTQVASHPFILYDPDHALQIGIGLNWRDTRIKFIDNSVVVEFRPVSTQPTAEENIAIMLFYLGRLFWSRQSHESLMSLDQVKYNRNQAMEKGMAGSLLVKQGDRVEVMSTPEALNIEIERAFMGLLDADLNAREINHFLGHLRTRVAFSRAPSDHLASKYYACVKKGFSPEEALVFGLNECRMLK